MAYNIDYIYKLQKFSVQIIGISVGKNHFVCFIIRLFVTSLTKKVKIGMPDANSNLKIVLQSECTYFVLALFCDYIYEFKKM